MYRFLLTGIENSTVRSGKLIELQGVEVSDLSKIKIYSLIKWNLKRKI